MSHSKITRNGYINYLLLILKLNFMFVHNYNTYIGPVTANSEHHRYDTIRKCQTLKKCHMVKSQI